MSLSPASTSAPARVTTASGGARRQRVLWDSDNATRGGKTSIGVLLEWLAAPGNYARWRGGKAQAGETREALCSEIRRAMRRHGLMHRENANIRTQISELERGFEAARAWLREAGRDVHTFRRVLDDGQADDASEETARAAAEAHVLRLCRYYHALDGVFGRDDDLGLRARRGPPPRPVAGPVPIRKRQLPGDDEAMSTLGTEAVAVETPDDRLQLMAGDSATVSVSTPVPAAAAAVAAATGGNGVSSVPVAGGTPVAVSATGPGAALAGSWANPAALESTQRMLAEAVREERDRKRFCMEEERHKLECEKLRYEVEAAKLKLTLDRALARKKLLDAGVEETQLNDLFSE